MSKVTAVDNSVILSHTGYLDIYGNYHVAGEVQNVGDQAINFVQVQATFYDSQNNVIDTRFDLTMLSTIPAGRESPFLIALLDPVQSSRVHRYSLDVTFLTTNPLPTGLQILSNNSYIDAFGQMHITGEIKNIEINKASNVRIVATYYDGKGDVVAASLTDLDPIEDDLSPGETRSFEILLSRERTPFVITYQLLAESLEYAMVTESPTLPHTLPTLPLFAILTLAVVALILVLSLISATKRARITSFSPNSTYPIPTQHKVL